MLTEYKVTSTSPPHSAQAACSLIVIHIHTHTTCSLIVIHTNNTYSYVFIDIHTHTTCSLTSCIIHQPNNYNYITSEEWPLHLTEDRPGTKVIQCGDILLRHKMVHMHACEIFNESIRIFANYFNRILDWISGFHSGFLDFTLDFWISVWISADGVRDFFHDRPLVPNHPHMFGIQGCDDSI